MISRRETDGGSVPVVRLISWSCGLLALASERTSARPASPIIIDLTSENPSLPLQCPRLQICYSDPLGTPHTCVFLERKSPMQPHIYSLTPKAASLEELIQKAKTFVAAAKAPATLKAYRNDWRDFESWCRDHQLTVAPLDAGDRRPLHRRPRLHFGVGHHRPPSHLDHQGAPGRRLHRLSCHDPPFCRGRDAQGYPPHDRHRAARKGPASLGRHPADHRRPARGPSRPSRRSSGAGRIRGRIPALGTGRYRYM